MKRYSIRLAMALLAMSSSATFTADAQAKVQEAQEKINNVTARSQAIFQVYQQIQNGSMAADAAAKSLGAALHSAITSAKTHYDSLTTQQAQDLFLASVLNSAKNSFTSLVPQATLVDHINGIKNYITAGAQAAFNFAGGFINGLTGSLFSAADSATSIMYAKEAPRS